MGELSFPALDKSRTRVLNALVRASRRRDALDVLGLTPGLAGELAKNAALKTAPTLPAAALYTGVLYDNLGLGTLDEESRRRAEESLLIFSGLWGVAKITDWIPPYRLSMGVTLPPIGGLAAFWRPKVAKELDRVPGLVVDLRSATYAGAWQPGSRSVTVRVFRDGKVVSHMAKATRGRSPAGWCVRRWLRGVLTSWPRSSMSWATPSPSPSPPAPTAPGSWTSTSPTPPLDLTLT
ncbi:YaaA family protein [Nonomuraea rubra]|uniref:YaaA family protein n=1 Tax=Nonomuraea rubra TaxID=46180 RepID=UPI003613E0D1